MMWRSLSSSQVRSKCPQIFSSQWRRLCHSENHNMILYPIFWNFARDKVWTVPQLKKAKQGIHFIAMCNSLVTKSAYSQQSGSELIDVRDKYDPPTEQPFSSITANWSHPLTGSLPPQHCVCLVERGHLFGPYLCSCLVRYSNASSIFLATPSKKQQRREEREKEREGKTLISQQLESVRGKAWATMTE